MRFDLHIGVVVSPAFFYVNKYFVMTSTKFDLQIIFELFSIDRAELPTPWVILSYQRKLIKYVPG